MTAAWNPVVFWMATWLGASTTVTLALALWLKTQSAHDAD
jgi:hypothetical protein